MKTTHTKHGVVCSYPEPDGAAESVAELFRDCKKALSKAKKPTGRDVGTQASDRFQCHMGWSVGTQNQSPSCRWMLSLYTPSSNRVL